MPLLDFLALPRKSVVLYSASGCHLCERARSALELVQRELGFKLLEVDITGDSDLEARFRELIPVVEIDGVQAFTYYVQPDVLRRKLGAPARPSPTGL